MLLLERVVAFPWERVLGLLLLAYATYTLAERHAFCSAAVAQRETDDRFLVESCSLDPRFSQAYDCRERAGRLEPESLNEAWWQCFWNSFYFYRSWMRIAGLPLLAVAALKTWHFLNGRDPPAYPGDVRYVDPLARALAVADPRHYWAPARRRRVRRLAYRPRSPSPFSSSDEQKYS